MPLDVSRIPYARVSRFHLYREEFLVYYGCHMFGGGSHHPPCHRSRKNLNTCALRMSLALKLAGARLTGGFWKCRLNPNASDKSHLAQHHLHNDWYKIKRPVEFRLPGKYQTWWGINASAGRFAPHKYGRMGPHLLSGGWGISGTKTFVRNQGRMMLIGQRGIIYFGWTGMGHITLWNQHHCPKGDDYFREATRLYFWPLA